MACGQRRSHPRKPARKTTPTAIGAATGHEAHERAADSVSPSVTANRPTALAAAPGRSSRRDPGLRAGLTATAVIATAMTANGMLTQKTEAQPEKRSRIPH